MSHIVTQEHIDANPFFASLNVPVGAEVEYDPAEVISREEAIARGIDVAAVEAAAEQPAPAPLEPRGFFALDVKWREGTTEAEVEAASSVVKEFAENLAEMPEDHIPACIESITVKRA